MRLYRTYYTIFTRINQYYLLNFAKIAFGRRKYRAKKREFIKIRKITAGKQFFRHFISAFSEKHRLKSAFPATLSLFFGKSQKKILKIAEKSLTTRKNYNIMQSIFRQRRRRKSKTYGVLSLIRLNFSRRYTFMTNVPEIFGSLVFSDSVMKRSLPKETYRAFRSLVDAGKPLTLEVARAHKGRARRVQLPQRRLALDVRGARLHRVGPHLRRVH